MPPGVCGQLWGCAHVTVPLCVSLKFKEANVQNPARFRHQENQNQGPVAQGVAPVGAPPFDFNHDLNLAKSLTNINRRPPSFQWAFRYKENTKRNAALH